MQEQILALSKEVSDLATAKVTEIQSVMRTTKMLAMNALIEAGRAGVQGRGFAVVAHEVNAISQQISDIAQTLNKTMADRIGALNQVGTTLVQSQRSARATDLALNMIEIIDRNLYERSCDVRWWATDSAVVEAAARPGTDTAIFATQRLGVILDSYTVYLDLWVLDLDGRVIANGRPDRYPNAVTQTCAGASWFRQALSTRDGSEFAVADIETEPRLGGQSVATYATAIRRGGATTGEVVGVLAIFFDWQNQSQAVVDGVRLSDEERTRTRCLLIDAKGRIIASSDRKGVLSERYDLRKTGTDQDAYVRPDGTIVGYALTPGYETYRGLGWYGVIEQVPLRS
ncbi:methyl-accepting chemotaxis protein [Lacibacterium aquatile]|uniref:Methyl-accepting chemotaxis protein n=1 Tax=Lacibacterium aquatile TaxID=1168082 RepID=A0ABW5DXW8_9PROT